MPFAVIGIYANDCSDRARQFLRAGNATISHFSDRELQLVTMLGASRLPLTVPVDAEGRIVDKLHGSKDWDGPQACALIARAFSAPARTASAR